MFSITFKIILCICPLENVFKCIDDIVCKVLFLTSETPTTTSACCIPDSSVKVTVKYEIQLFLESFCIAVNRLQKSSSEMWHYDFNCSPEF